MMRCVAAAIATIESSRRTHVEWRDHWLKMESEGHADCATCAETAKLAGGRQHQEDCIAEYDNVLNVLRTATGVTAAWEDGAKYAYENAADRTLTSLLADNPLRP